MWLQIQCCFNTQEYLPSIQTLLALDPNIFVPNMNMFAVVIASSVKLERVVNQFECLLICMTTNIFLMPHTHQIFQDELLIAFIPNPFFCDFSFDLLL